MPQLTPEGLVYFPPREPQAQPAPPEAAVPAAQAPASVAAPAAAQAVEPAAVATSASEPAPATREEFQAAQAEGRAPPRSSAESFALKVGGDLAADEQMARSIKDEEAASLAAMEAKAKGDEARAEELSRQATTLGEHEKQITEENKARVASFRQKQEAIDADIENYGKQVIDPGRLYRNASTEHKLIVGLGALSAGFLDLRGFGRGNPVLKSMEDAINRDIEAQKETLNVKYRAIGAKGDLLRMGMDMAKEERAAADLARAVAFQQLSKQAEARAARTDSEVGRHNMEIAAAAFAQKAIESRQSAGASMHKSFVDFEQHRLDQSARRMSIALQAQSLKSAKAEEARRAEEFAMKKAEATAVAPENLITRLRRQTGIPTLTGKEIVTSSFLVDPSGNSIEGIAVSSEDAQKDIRQSMAISGRTLGDLDVIASKVQSADWSELKNPASVVRQEIDGLYQQALIKMRDPGSGALTNMDAQRLESVLGSDLTRLFTVARKEAALAKLVNAHESLQRSINEHIDGADIGQTGAKYKRDMSLYRAARGKGTDAPPTSRIENAALDLKPPEAFKAPEGSTDREVKAVKMKSTLEQAKRVKAALSNKTVNKAVDVLRGDPSSEEYQGAVTSIRALEERFGELFPAYSRAKESGDQADKEFVKSYELLENALSRLSEARRLGPAYESPEKLKFEQEQEAHLARQRRMLDPEGRLGLPR